jgi:hypothetical protein
LSLSLGNPQKKTEKAKGTKKEESEKLRARAGGGGGRELLLRFLEGRSNPLDKKK